MANAIYFKAPWYSQFNAELTKLSPFHVRGSAVVDVPTMYHHGHFGYARRDGFIALALPYIGSELQFLVLLPGDAHGLPALESKLTPETLAQCAKLEDHDLQLYIPKFKLEPPTMPLSAVLKSLGMKTAFDQPPGSANFDRIAPRKPNDYLYVSEVFHKTFIAVDENGTHRRASFSQRTHDRHHRRFLQRSDSDFMAKIAPVHHLPAPALPPRHLVRVVPMVERMHDGTRIDRATATRLHCACARHKFLRTLVAQKIS